MLWNTLIWLWNGANLSIYKHVTHFVPNIYTAQSQVYEAKKENFVSEILKSGIKFSLCGAAQNLICCSLNSMQSAHFWAFLYGPKIQ